MKFNFSSRMAARHISRQIERKELKKFIAEIGNSLSIFLSIWFETTTEVDTLKIKKKGVKHNGKLFLI
ncbi:Uncharacterised protein [uncultured archaeon]|nr:Uncharacterised protein [uncultured archaeon]